MSTSMQGVGRKVSVPSAATEQPDPERVVAEHWDARARRAALASVTDQAVLAHVARVDPTAAVREAATDKLADGDLLREIANHDDDDVVREAALDRLQVLGEPAVATQGSPRSARRRSVRQLALDVTVMLVCVGVCMWLLLAPIHGVVGVGPKGSALAAIGFATYRVVVGLGLGDDNP